MKPTQILLWALLIINISVLAFLYQTRSQPTTIPQLVGTWSGLNQTVSDDKGYKQWKKTIQITEQKDRRFRGTLSYPGGTKHFFGVIYPDNRSFTWVSVKSHGYVHGRILNDHTIAACYVEAYEQATAGCATLERQ